MPDNKALTINNDFLAASVRTASRTGHCRSCCWWKSLRTAADRAWGTQRLVRKGFLLSFLIA